MESVQLKLDEAGQGAFYMMKGDGQLGEMVIDIAGDKLSVLHTEVAKEAEGKGLAKKLFEAMTAYAREKNLKVVPLCSYVSAQFKRHPREHADIWQEES